MPRYQQRNNHKVYGGHMSETMPASSRKTFADWLNYALNELKTARKWSRRRAIGESGVPRGTVYRWLDGAIPDRGLLLQFCSALELEIAEPFGLLGWDPAGPSTSPEQVGVPLVLSERVRKLEAVMRDPDLGEEERTKYEGLLDLIQRDIEAAISRQRRHDDNQTGQ